MRSKSAALCLLVVLVVDQMALAETPEEKGLAIAKKSEQLDQGFGDFVVDGEMTIASKNGKSADRRFEMSTLEVTGDGDKRLIVLSHPRDVKGTVSLTFSHGLEPDDQWIYLPSLRRTKRLTARDKTGSFIGSEFAFEDIGTWELKKFTYKWLRDEEIDGADCYVVEEYPAYQYSGYTRLVDWIDQEIHQSRKIVYYDHKDRPLKELRFYDYKQYGGKYWRPGRTEMTNLQNGNVSTVDWQDYRFGTGLSDRDFAPTRLERVSR